jgi:hypothetical protein
MKKIIALTALASMVISGQPLAQIDPDSDGFGMYFDLDATDNCVPWPAGPVYVYLILTNASEPTGISGWECHVTYTVPAGCFEVGWTLPAGSLNVSTAPDFVVGLAAPVPNAPTIQLATLCILVFCVPSIYFYVGPADTPSIPGFAAYAAGENSDRLIPMYPSSGNSNWPVAGMNIDCEFPPFSTEDETFGGIKAMYR